MAGNKEFCSRPHLRPPTPPSPRSTQAWDPKLQPLLRQHNTNTTFQPIKFDVPIWENILVEKMGYRLIWGLTLVWLLFTIVYFTSTLSAVMTKYSKGVRTVWVYHITWLVNSACHVWGNQAWNTRDLSTNNWWVAVVSFGEGWHNNHRAFEYSTRHGLEWWQVDMTWCTIRLLQTLGLAKDVKLPTEAHKQRMTFKSQGTEE